MNKKKLLIIFLIVYVIGVIALTIGGEDTAPVPIYQAIFTAIPASVVIVGVGYGVYFAFNYTKTRKERIRQEQKRTAEEQKVKAEQERKARIANAEKLPCPACGAPVSVLSPKCEYCGTANPNYRE